MGEITAELSLTKKGKFFMNAGRLSEGKTRVNQKSDYLQGYQT